MREDTGRTPSMPPGHGSGTIASLTAAEPLVRLARAIGAYQATRPIDRGPGAADPDRAGTWPDRRDAGEAARTRDPGDATVDEWF